MRDRFARQLGCRLLVAGVGSAEQEVGVSGARSDQPSAGSPPSFELVGCGAGRALIKLATAYPASECTGYDAFEGQLERARRNAAAAGLDERITFALRDVATEGLPRRFDLITTFDVVHDAVDPLALMQAIRTGLEPGGTYLLLEINCADHAHDNAGPIAQVLYGFSLLYCMTSSLAHDGAGLGTCGLPERKIRQLAADAGFGTVTRVAENPFNVLYALTA